MHAHNVTCMHITHVWTCTHTCAYAMHVQHAHMHTFNTHSHTCTCSDNLIYRIGSDRIPIEVPKKDGRPISNASSQHYDIPHDNHNRTLYNIPQPNGTPSIHESQNYSVVRPLSQTASTIQGSNGAGVEAHNGTPSIHESHNYSVVRPLSQTASTIQGSNAAEVGAHNGTPSIHESQNYSVVRPLSQTASTIQGSNAAEVEAHNGHNTDTLLQSTATGDYIFMDNNDTEAIENEENVSFI